MKRTRLYNTATGKWEYWTICPPPKAPWRVAWVRLRAFLRYARGHHTPFLGYGEEAVYDFDPDTLQMRDPKRERRMRRRDRRDRLTAKAANALNSMVEMQKFIK